MDLPEIHCPQWEISAHGDTLTIAFRVRALNEDEDLEELGRHLFSLVDQFGWYRLIVNLAGVELISSSFMGKLITLHRRLHRTNGRLVVCGFSEPTAEVMHTSKLDEYLHTATDVASALESFR